MSPRRRSLVALVLLLLALGLMALGAARLMAPRAGLESLSLTAWETPITLRWDPARPPGPLVILAHGFAGSRPLMDPLAVALARAGYRAASYDSLGHGRNTAPMIGDIDDPEGTTLFLLDELEQVVRALRTDPHVPRPPAPAPAPLVLVGHSMASDIVIRAARERLPEYRAVVTLSLFSPAVTATEPPNLLVLDGALEPPILHNEALRVLALAAPEGSETAPTFDQTLGDPAAGTGRRASLIAGAEHIGVLFARQSQTETLAWLRAALGPDAPPPPAEDPTTAPGPALVLLLLGAVLLAWPLAQVLPRVTDPASPFAAEAQPPLSWGKLAPILILPTLATPLILRVLPTDVLPVLMADYVALHMALFGLLTGALTFWTVRREEATTRAALSRLLPPLKPGPGGGPALALCGLGALVFGLFALNGPIDAFVTTVIPGPERLGLLVAMILAGLVFFLADEALARGPGRGPRGRRRLAWITKGSFALSLGLAVALDFQGLFFLLILLPVLVLFFVLSALFGAWCYRRTGHSLVGALANAGLFALPMTSVFPVLG